MIGGAPLIGQAASHLDIWGKLITATILICGALYILIRDWPFWPRRKR